MESDINVVLCYVLSQYPKNCCIPELRIESATIRRQIWLMRMIAGIRNMVWRPILFLVISMEEVGKVTPQQMTGFIDAIV
jgi:hypothetical protein